MSGDMDFLFKPIVLVTGFGPFINHPVNASWEAVKLLDKDEIETKHNIELVTLEIPVSYENVDEFAPALWETYTPKLMIHVGVSRLAKCLTLETQAHKKGYQRFDYLDKCPPNHTCPADGAIRIHTKLDVERVCRQFNETESGDQKSSVVSSKDAGRFLCEYIYYWSLSSDNSRTLFVHVPDMDVYSPQRTARALARVLDLCLEQMEELEKTSAITNKLKRVNLQCTNEL